MAKGGEKRKAEIIDGLATQLGSRLRGDRGRARAAVRAGLLPRRGAGRPGRARSARSLRRRPGPAPLGRVRQPGRGKLRVYNPKLEQHGWQSTHTVVEIVNDDMPFLVDSVGIELNRHGLSIHLVIHPVLAVRRDEAGRLLDLGTAEQVGDGPARELHASRDRPAERPGGADAARGRPAPRPGRRPPRGARLAGDARPGSRSRRRSRAGASPVPAERGAEAEAFLRWLGRRPLHPAGLPQPTSSRTAAGVQLRRMKGTALGILRASDDGALSPSFTALPLEIRERAREPLPLLTVTKANTRSTVHRGTYLDFIGVKRFAPDGSVVGEHRFLGLLTSTAYSMSPRQIPLLDRKVERVIDRAAFRAAGHAGKALAAHHRDLPARRAAPDPRGRAVRHRDGHPPPGGPAAAAAVRPPRPLRPLRHLPRLRAARPLQHGDARAHGGAAARGGRRHRERVPGPAVRVQARPAAVHPAHAAWRAGADRHGRASSVG